MSNPNQREALETILRRYLTAETLRESVLTTDGDADWTFAARHWADYLAQELEAHVRLVDRAETEAA